MHIIIKLNDAVLTQKRTIEQNNCGRNFLFKDRETANKILIKQIML